MKPRLTLDFETRSMCNLKTAGAYKYSLDPTTQPTCLAFKVRGEPTVYFLPFEVINRPWKKLPKKLRDLWMRFLNEGFEFSAHNAFFERCIYTHILVKRYGWPPIPVLSWRCTAAKAAACSLPRNLAGAGEAMALTIQKDKMGYNAMMATCKPSKQWNAWFKACAEQKAGVKIGARKLGTIAKGEPPVFLEYEHNPETWQTLYVYCKIDVRAEEKLDESLPDLIPAEQEIWHLNQRLNWRGLKIDIPTAKKIIEIMSVESKMKLNELDALTAGLITKPGARKSILDFLALDGIELPDIRANTIEEALGGENLPENMRRLLEIRKALSKTSTRKYQSFIDRAGRDERVRDILLYHGASTGRDTGTGIQPHNFPRGVIEISKDRPYAPIQNVIECEAGVLRLLYGDSLAMLFSSILRNMILPSEGAELFVADFSKIEVAVLWWLAENVPGLEILKSGKDPYKYLAAANTGKRYEDISDEGDERQLGKAQVLGCGFGMGWKKFKKTAWDQYRLVLTSAQAKLAVKNYREANETVPALWKMYETAAILSIESEGKVVRAGKCKFVTKDSFLWVELPSGRRLAYRNPEITWRVREYEYNLLDKDGDPLYDENGDERTETRYTQPQKTIEFWAVNSKTKKWAQERTWGGTLTENIVQAVARDLMMGGMVKLERAGYKMLLTVHDEALTEKTIGTGNLSKFEKIMCEMPKWADKELPLSAKAWLGPRYKK